jgi:hypothetical protein
LGDIAASLLSSVSWFDQALVVMQRPDSLSQIIDMPTQPSRASAAGITSSRT